MDAAVYVPLGLLYALALFAHGHRLLRPQQSGGAAEGRVEKGLWLTLLTLVLHAVVQLLSMVKMAVLVGP